MTTTGTRGGTPSEDIGERRRAEILDAAEDLLAVHGFDSLRLRDVSKKAGVSIGMIQHYFETRDTLLRETIRVANARRAKAWSQLGTVHSDARSRITALLEGALNDPHRCTVWVETSAAASRHAELRGDFLQTQHAWHDALRSAIDAGVESGELEPRVDVEDVVSLLVGLIDGFMLEIAAAGVDAKRHADHKRILGDLGRRLLGLEPGDL